MSAFSGFAFVSGLFLFCGCSAGSPTAAGDAGDASPLESGATSTPLDASSVSACSTNPPTGDFPLDVGAVLKDKCQTCHRNPPVSHAPFPLVDYEDMLATFKGQVIWESASRAIQPGASPFMPFPPAPLLTASEKQVLDAWFAGCAQPVAEGTGADQDSRSGAEAGILDAPTE
jgi:hypothetical protein